LVVDGKVTAKTAKKIYEVLHYETVDDEGVAALIAKLPADKQEGATALVKSVREHSNQKALASMAVFPAIMLLAYIGLIFYFRSTGGYKPKVIGAH